MLGTLILLILIISLPSLVILHAVFHFRLRWISTFVPGGMEKRLELYYWDYDTKPKTRKTKILIKL